MGEFNMLRLCRNMSVACLYVGRLFSVDLPLVGKAVRARPFRIEGCIIRNHLFPA